MAEAVKVIVRCRPMNNRERNLGCKDILSIVNNLAQCSIRNPNDDKAPPKSFTFDGAYDKSSAMEEIYADIGFPLVEGVVEGYNGTIFAYGQTGSGKSYSMQGVSDPPANRGIIPRAFDHIFETIQVSEGSKYLVHASYLEIYNEEVRDLLGKDIKQRLELKEHPDKGVYVMGLSMHPCGKVSDCEKIMEKGWSNRSTGATLMNADSSRSHSIFSIHLERSDTNDNGEQHIRAAKLNLVDLAGSERQGKTGATGDRLKEATKINLSLSALGNVISALVDGKSTHIPYRDSKLTRLLQDSLGGNTKTLMVACLSPADNNYDETLSTLRYANRAKNIKNKPKINEDPKDAMLREYQDEINKLKAMLRGEIPVQIDGSTSTVAHKRSKASSPGLTKEEVEKEKKALQEEFEKEMKLMKEELLSVKASKEETEQKMAQLGNEFEHRMKDISEAAPLINQESFIQEEVPIGNKQKDRKQLVPSEQMRKLSRADVQQISFQAREDEQETSEPVDNVNSNSSEALLRLQELEQKMVGGELANNEEVKERRRKKKKHAEERTRKLQEALLRKDGDEIMIDIYESVHDKLRAVNKKLESEMSKSESLQREITDLQSEFEFDRIDYLNTIRRQEEQILWFQAVVDRIHPLVRSGCNYGNLDRIRSLSKWDETNRQWTLPKVTMEDVQLPVSGGDAATEYRENRIDGNRRMSSFESNGTNQMDRYKMKLESSEGQQIANNYFKNNRAEELLHRVSLPSKGMNGSLPNFLAGRPSMVAEMDDGMSWKPPTRLEALPVSAPSKHSSKKPNRKL